MIKDFHKTAIIAGEKEISYSEMLCHIDRYAAVMNGCEREKTLIFSENSEGWIYAFFSVWKTRGIAVPVDATATVSDVSYILNDCHPERVWVSRQTEPVIRQAIAETGSSTSVLIIDDYEREEIPAGKPEGIRMPDMDTTALIIYTSGTTGNPKGVMLSYKNLWANMNSVSVDVPILTAERRVLMLLPIHHVLPLMGTMIIPIIQGGGIIICPTLSGPDIMAALARGKVGAIVGVPRLWQTLYGGIKKKIDEHGITRFLFNVCAKMKSKRLSRLIFASVHKKLGGHLDYCVSGGAALPPEIVEGLTTLGLDVLEGYGMTETAPIIAFTRPGDTIPGSVGLPLPGVECKLLDGELLAKGPNVMQGYYNRPEETAAVIDKDGFVHTGDLARLDEKGRVYITGRCKEIIVLSNGKNVQPSEIEYKLEKYDDKVKEAAVMQDGDMLRAIIVPQELWARGKSDAELEELLKKEVLQSYNQTVTNYKKLMSVSVYRGALPRTKLDKLQRFKLKELVDKSAKREDTSSELSQRGTSLQDNGSQMSEVLRILINYIEGEKKIGVRATDHLETDLAFDSLDRVEMQGFIEATFGVEVKADQLATFPSIEALAQFIEEKKTRMEVEDVDWHAILSEDVQLHNQPSCSHLLPVGLKAFKGFFRIYNRLSIKGKKNLPKSGPFILAPNHLSLLDTPVAMAGIPYRTIRQCYFYTAEKHVKSNLRKHLARHNNLILMQQGDLKNSIVRMAKVLREGKNLVIFPEGTRSKDGNLLPFKKTFAILSKELNVPIIPVLISGTQNAMGRGMAWIRPRKITVEYMPAILPQGKATYDELSGLVRAALE